MKIIELSLPEKKCYFCNRSEQDFQNDFQLSKIPGEVNNYVREKSDKIRNILDKYTEILKKLLDDTQNYTLDLTVKEIIKGIDVVKKTMPKVLELLKFNYVGRNFLYPNDDKTYRLNYRLRKLRDTDSNASLKEIREKINQIIQINQMGIIDDELAVVYPQELQDLQKSQIQNFIKYTFPEIFSISEFEIDVFTDCNGKKVLPNIDISFFGKKNWIKHDIESRLDFQEKNTDKALSLEEKTQIIKEEWNKHTDDLLFAYGEYGDNNGYIFDYYGSGNLEDKKIHEENIIHLKIKVRICGICKDIYERASNASFKIYEAEQEEDDYD